jgi:hypothetical protein
MMSGRVLSRCGRCVPIRPRVGPPCYRVRHPCCTQNSPQPRLTLRELLAAEERVIEHALRPASLCEHPLCEHPMFVHLVHRSHAAEERVIEHAPRNAEPARIRLSYAEPRHGGDRRAGFLTPGLR